MRLHTPILITVNFPEIYERGFNVFIDSHGCRIQPVIKIMASASRSRFRKKALIIAFPRGAKGQIPM